VVVALTEGLAERGKRAWVDLEDIPPSAEWMAEIRSAIDGADGYLVVVSPELARSKVCAVELDHAREAGKRIVPVMVRPTDPQTMPDLLAGLNWIDASEPARVHAALDEVVTALDTDLDRVKAHTHLLVRATDWRRGDEDRSLLLRGRELNEAEALLADVAGEPQPTQLQTRFVLTSRKAAGRRQRGAIAVVTVLLLVAASLGVVALVQRNSAVQNERLALERAAESRSRELASASVGQLDVDPELSLLLAREALESATTPEAVEALRQSLSESRVRMTLTGHEGGVSVVSFSPDGTHLLTASYDGTARIWDLATPTDPLVLEGHSDLIETASFSPDGSSVVTASFDGTAKVWDAVTGQESVTLRGHEGAVHDAAFSPDGRLIITAGDDQTARVWDAATGTQVQVLRGHDRPVYDASFSPDGKLIVTASDDDTARVWDVRTGRLLHVFRGHEDGLYTAAFDPAGSRVVTASEDQTAKIWDVGSGRMVADLSGGRAPVVVAGFSPDGSTVLTASEDGTAQIWDASSGRQLSILRGHGDQIGAASFSPDGRFVVTASADGTARVWSAGDGTVASILRGHTGEVLSAAFSPDGERVATGGIDGTARIWEPLSGQVLIRGDVSNYREETGGDRIAVSTWDGFVHIFDARSGRELVTIDAGAPLSSASFSGDGALVASGGLDGVGRIWDSHTGDLVAELHGHEPVYTSADFYGQDDRVLTWSDDGTARLWDARSGEQLAMFDHGAAGGKSIWEAHMSPDGSKVFTTGVVDGRIEMWDVASGEKLWGQTGLLSTGGIGAGFSPDGRLVGTVSAEAFIWDADTGRKVATLDDPGKAEAVNFFPDGKTVITRSTDGAARTWDARTGDLLTVMPGHGGPVDSAYFSQDGRWIATTADDGLTRVWDASSGEPITTFEGVGGAGRFASFVAEAPFVVSWSESGVRVDRCDACGSLAELRDRARNRVTRTFTHAERSEFLGMASSATEGLLPPARDGLTDEAGQSVPDGPLPGGRYSAVGFDPQLSFALEDGWQATTFLNDLEEGETLGTVVQLQQADLPSNGLAFILLDPARAIDGRKEWDERRNIVPFPRDFPGWLATHPNLETQPPETVTIGGVEALSVQSLVTSVPRDNPWPVCGGCVTLLAFSLDHQTGPITTDDLINALGPGEVDRWIVLDTGGSKILVNFFSASQKDFDEFLPTVQGVLDTVRIGA
jgi:WD40 repeat protein